MKENNFLSVVLYCHEIAQETISYFSKALYEGLLHNFKNYEVILVNDACHEEKLNDLSNELNKYVEHNTISIIKFPHFVGIEVAMTAGDNLAIGDYIFEIDYINVHFSKDTLMSAYHALMKGNDIVSIEPTHIKKKLSSTIFYKLYNHGVSEEQKIGHDIFRIISRRAFNRVKASMKTIPYRKASYTSCGLTHLLLKDDSIVIASKKHDKNVLKNRTTLGIDTLLIFTNTIQRFAITISLIFLALTILIAGYTIYIFVSSSPVAGWTPIMLYLSIGFFGIFAMLAIVLRFLSVILDIVYKKENYKYESIRKV